MRVEDAGNRHPYARDTLDNARIDNRRQTKPAVGGVDRCAEQTQLLHALDDVFRIDVVMLECLSVRFDVPFKKAIDAGEDDSFGLVILARVRFAIDRAGRHVSGCRQAADHNTCFGL